MSFQAVRIFFKINLQQQYLKWVLSILHCILLNNFTANTTTTTSTSTITAIITTTTTVTTTTNTNNIGSNRPFPNVIIFSNFVFQLGFNKTYK